MVIILMGVSGSGKTTIGELLAARLGIEFCDADALHPPENVRKMAEGVPLTDDDRTPWLEAVRRFITERLEQDKDAVIACSALKEKYRRFLGIGGKVKCVYLHGEFALIAERMRRRDHFMKPEMLQSQFDDLEEPSDCFEADVARPPEAIVDQIITELGIQDSKIKSKPGHE